MTVKALGLAVALTTAYASADRSTAAFTPGAGSRSEPVCRAIHERLRDRDPIHGGAFEARFLRYQPDGPLHSSVVIVGTGMGRTPNETAYARDLCARGLQVFVVDGFTQDHDSSDEWSADHDLLERGAWVVRRLAARSPGPVAGFGSSGGGIPVLLAAARERKITTLVLLGTAAPWADVLAVTEQNSNERRRARRMKAAGLTSPEAYRVRLAQALPNDPGHLIAKHAKRLKTLMLIPGRDTYMPTSLQWTLARRLGRPRILEERKLGHIPAISFSYFGHGAEIVDFIEDGLRFPK